MNKLTKLAAAMAIIMGAGQASADFIFDADGSGSDYAGINMSNFSMDQVTSTKIFLDLGDDDTLSVGDVFTEQVFYSIAKSRLETTDPFGAPFTSDVQSYDDDLIISMSLTGKITQYNANGDAATTLANASTNFANDVWSLSFNGQSGTMYYDNDSSITTSLNSSFGVNPFAGAGDEIVLATFGNITGGTDNASFDNSTATVDFGLTMEFASALAGIWTFTEGDAADILAITPVAPTIYAIADASVNLTHVGGALTGVTLPGASAPLVNDMLILTVADNGASSTAFVPEPASLALMGLGLLGMGAAGRRRKA